MFECSLMTHQPASKTLIESIVPDSLFLFLLSSNSVVNLGLQRMLFAII